jgi:hypothetical protein
MNVEALASFLSNTCADLFVDMVQHTNEADKVEALAQVIAWSMRYRDSVKKHGGFVEQGLDEMAPMMVVASINILYGS